MKKIIHFLLLIILILKMPEARAQQSKTDSLLKVLESSKEDTNKVKTLNRISKAFLQKGDYESAKEYATSSTMLAKKLNYKKGLAFAYVLLQINSNDNSRNYQEALEYGFRALRVYKEINDEDGIASTYANIGVNYDKQNNYSEARRYYLLGLELFEKNEKKSNAALTNEKIGIASELQGDWPEALKYYLDALKLYEELGEKDRIASSFNNLALVYYHQKNYADALKYAFQCLKLSEEIDSKLYMAISYSTLGNIYTSQANYSEALSTFLNGLKISEKMENTDFIAAFCGNIGDLYADQGNYSESLKYNLKGLKISMEINDKYTLGHTYHSIGNAYSKLGSYDSALNNLYKGMFLGIEMADKELMAISYQDLAESYYQLHNLDSTYHYFNLYSAIKDTLLNEENSKQINEMQTKYETEKKDKEITVLNLENEKKQSSLALLDKQRKIAELNFQNEQQQRQLVTSENDRNKQSLLLAGNLHKQQQDSISNLSVQKTMMAKLAANERNKRNYAVAGGIGIAMFLSLLFYQLYRRRETRNTLAMNQLKNKVLRSQLNPHFIFNALNSIKNFIQQHPDVADNYLTKFSILMRQVLENSEEEKITLSEEIAMIENYMQLESLRLPLGFDYAVSLDPSIDANNIMVPPLILQPMIENAIWHGLKPLKHRGKISLLFSERNGLLEAVIEDDGVGLGSTLVNTASPEKKRSMGMQITRERIELMNRKARVKGWLRQQLLEGGSNVRLAIPV
ncbi:MAG TPA: tetratricopeptide repeat protein [Chitinophagales bacterium]|nr:tetratricopeptide repeat protein [Chitinophagales bacterium]